MSDKEQNKSLDVLGIKPVAESINAVTEGTVNGASAFLSRICLPAAEEFGLLLKDKVSSWRAKNAIAIAMKAQELLSEQMSHVTLSAHPRIVYESIEKGSWAEDVTMQNMWAGLLASSCTKEGKDESNLIFINYLSQLTSSQGKIIKHICEHAKVGRSPGGWISAEELVLDVEILRALTGIDDEHQIDHELDHLRGLELIAGGFNPDSSSANILPTAIALQLYARGQGFVGSPFDFYQQEESNSEGSNDKP
ncbi:MAG: Abi-alpha family protein [Candidatus Thiodiazotropha endolucinida]